MRIEDLARLSHEPFHIHRHFRAVTAMSPLQFQKRIRLQEARSLLVATRVMSRGSDTSSATTAPPQFNREYRRLFGTPPGHHAGRLRTDGELDGRRLP